MKLKKFAIAALFGAQLLGTSALAQAADTKPVAPPAISVLTADKKAIAEDLTVTGSFAAGELVLVSPEIEGLSVTEFLVEEGDTVKKGQVLARLNSASIDIQITQSKASLARNDFALDQAKNAIEQAQINRDHADADLERTKKLHSTGIATQQTLDQFQATYDLANAQLSNAKLGLEAAQADRVGIEAQLAGFELNKSRTEIKSPVDGYVSNRSVQIGGIASGSKSPMYQIVADGVVKLIAEIPEADMPRLALGQKATITINGYAKPIEGEVKLISPEINETTRVGLAHIRVAENVRIPLGAFGRARISLAAAEGVALPLTAVTFGNNGPTVQIVKNNKVEVRKVVTGLVGTDDVEITSGVEPGEVFVARAGSFVRDGDAVTPVPLTVQ
jgi:HlyD family secretion protein